MGWWRDPETEKSMLAHVRLMVSRYFGRGAVVQPNVQVACIIVTPSQAAALGVLVLREPAEGFMLFAGFDGGTDGGQSVGTWCASQSRKRLGAKT